MTSVKIKTRLSRSREARKIQRARIMHPSGEPIVLTPVFPNVGVQLWYQAQLDELIARMYQDTLQMIIPAVKDTPVIIAADAAPPTHAGVMFRCGPRILLLARSDGQGWAFPGGGIEPGETPEQAARREVFEELSYRYDGPLRYSHVQVWRDVRFATFTADCPAEFFPVLDYEHTNSLWITPQAALELLELHPGVSETLKRPVDLASDATPAQLQRLLEKWGRQWVERFDLMAQKISLDFSARNKNATEAGMQASLRKAGFTVPFKPTKASIEAYKVVAAEQVGLIKSIAQKYHTDVQTKVWESVKRGGDLKTLSKELSQTYGVTKRRAALIALDQNAKAKAIIEAVRHRELGIRQAIWMHSRAGKEPRPSHVKMNNKLYDLTKGMWDEDEQKYVHPGELINCRCTMRPYIPGFEPAMPEWEIAQT